MEVRPGARGGLLPALDQPVCSLGLCLFKNDLLMPFSGCHSEPWMSKDRWSISCVFSNCILNTVSNRSTIIHDAAIEAVVWCLGGKLCLWPWSTKMPPALLALLRTSAQPPMRFPPAPGGGGASFVFRISSYLSSFDFQFSLTFLHLYRNDANCVALNTYTESLCRKKKISMQNRIFRKWTKGFP